MPSDHDCYQDASPRDRAVNLRRVVISLETGGLRKAFRYEDPQVRRQWLSGLEHPVRQQVAKFEFVQNGVCKQRSAYRVHTPCGMAVRAVWQPPWKAFSLWHWRTLAHITSGDKMVKLSDAVSSSRRKSRKVTAPCSANRKQLAGSTICPSL